MIAPARVLVAILCGLTGPAAESNPPPATIPVQTRSDTPQLPATALSSHLDSPEQYRRPPPVMAQVLEAPMLPELAVSPDRKWLALAHQRALPGIDELAVPRIELVKRSIDLRTLGAFDFGANATGMTIVDLATAEEWPLKTPAGGLSPPLWSPDSRAFLFRSTTLRGAELWIAELKTRATRVLTGPVLGTAHSAQDPPCTWLPDARHVLCHLVPEGRGAPPQRPPLAPGPVIEEASREGARAPTYAGYLRDAHDEALYEFFMSSQPVLIDTATGEQRRIGPAGVYDALSASPDGRYLLSVRIVPPYPHFVTDDRFAKEVQILDLHGRPVHTLASIASGGWGNTGAGWMSPQARRFVWYPAAPSTVAYIEPLDGGNPQSTVPHGDRLMLVEPPFTGQPIELIRTQWRLPGAYHANVRYSPDPDYANVAWLEDGRAWVEEIDSNLQRKRIWLVDARHRRSKPEFLREFSTKDLYNNPGSVLLTRGLHPRKTVWGLEEPILRQDGDHVYLAGVAASAQGDRPFLDRFNLKTHNTERLFIATGETHEYILAVLDTKARRVLTRFESPTQPPNYYQMDLRTHRRAPITHLPHPAPQLEAVRVEKISYTRSDGVDLAGMLYLPMGYRSGDRVPVVIWAYPIEFADVTAAAHVNGSPYAFQWYLTQRFILATRLLTTQGYAVLWNASMPVIGGARANDTAVEQLADNARAAIDKLVAMGVADRARIAIAGHSYGAFMAATLLAHTDLFAAGIAIDGAYNLTNVPLGFQNETRTFWEAPQVYLQLSALVHADKIKAPLLLIHGQLDDNYGSRPIESQQLYQALQGLGRTTRLVMLPYEGHQPRARESVLQVAWEMLNWCDRYLKSPPIEPPASMRSR